MKNVIVFIQARMSSTRLPGKVLLKICNKPMIELQLERMKRSKYAEKIIVLTSTEKSDDILVKTLEKMGQEVFRGSLHNVLKRFLDASKKYPSNHYVRTTADCPLIDPNLIDQTIKQHLAQKNDYTSNILKRTFPVGTDIEIFTAQTLEKNYALATTEAEKEHVTPYIYNHPESFKLGNYKNKIDHSNLRWTVDTPEDFEFVRTIYEKLYTVNPSFTYENIIENSKIPNISVQN